MRFVRAHGLGNDYLVLTDGAALDAGLVRQICHRHTGVGGDGILEPTATEQADYGVRIWNPDGSVAEKSGNGLRIFARWLRDTGAPEAFTVHTGTDKVGCVVHDDGIEVEMGTVVFDSGTAEPVALDSGPIVGLSLSVGNPHFVCFGSAFDAQPWRGWGAELEVHDRFPNRTNVQFAEVCGPDWVDIRIWERGAGETSASGSSSCAAAAAAVKLGHIEPGCITVTMPGGALHVTVRPDWSVLLLGPVEVVGTVDVDARWLAARGC